MMKPYFDTHSAGGAAPDRIAGLAEHGGHPVCPAVAVAGRCHQSRPAQLLARLAVSGDKEPAAEVDLVKVEQFLVALGPPARFKISAQLAHHALLDYRADPVPDRYAAPDLLVEVQGIAVIA